MKSFKCPSEHSYLSTINKCTVLLRIFAIVFKIMKTAEIKQSRFELRLSNEDKAFFEKASKISGYTTLASFVTSTVKDRAKRIIKENEQILASQKDKEIFFNAVFSDLEPSEKLKQAANKYIDSV